MRYCMKHCDHCVMIKKVSKIKTIFCTYCWKKYIALVASGYMCENKRDKED